MSTRCWPRAPWRRCTCGPGPAPGRSGRVGLVPHADVAETDAVVGRRRHVSAARLDGRRGRRAAGARSRTRWRGPSRGRARPPRAPVRPARPRAANRADRPPGRRAQEEGAHALGQRQLGELLGPHRRRADEEAAAGALEPAGDVVEPAHRGGIPAGRRPPPRRCARCAPAARPGRRSALLGSHPSASAAGQRAASAACSAPIQMATSCAGAGPACAPDSAVELAVDPHGAARRPESRG